MPVASFWGKQTGLDWTQNTIDNDHGINKKTDDLMKSVTNNPAALTLGAEPATPSMTRNPEATTIESVPNWIELLTVSNDQDTPVEEVSLYREDSNDELSMNDPNNVNPSKFIFAYLMLYVMPALKEVVSVQTAVVADMNESQLATKQVSIVSSE